MLTCSTSSVEAAQITALFHNRHFILKFNKAECTTCALILHAVWDSQDNIRGNCIFCGSTPRYAWWNFTQSYEVVKDPNINSTEHVDGREASLCWLHFPAVSYSAERLDWGLSSRPGQTRLGRAVEAQHVHSLFSQQIKGLRIRISQIYVYLCTLPALVSVGRGEVRKWPTVVTWVRGQAGRSLQGWVYSLVLRDRRVTHQRRGLHLLVLLIEHMTRSTKIRWDHVLIPETDWKCLFSQKYVHINKVTK